MVAIPVIHGASSGEFNLAGCTVGAARTSLLDAFNLGRCRIAFVNGERVPASYRLIEGDTLEFSVGWGKKGGDQKQQKFKTILADPPWPYNSPRAVVGNGGRGSQNGKAANIIQTDVLDHYNVMSLDDIRSLPISELVEDNAHLYLWTTNPFMVEAHEVARAWGFKPKTIITWVKLKKDRTPSMKTGYWFRSATEHVLFAVRGKMRLKGPASPTTFFSPRLPHSVKPDQFYELIESQSPGPYLEIFARRSRPGWAHWGNEMNPTVSFEETPRLGQRDFSNDVLQTYLARDSG